MSLDKNTPKGKGLRTAYQAVIGTVLAFVTGLWAIPEVQIYVNTFIREEGVGLAIVLLGLVGFSSGLISYLQNKRGK